MAMTEGSMLARVVVNGYSSRRVVVESSMTVDVRVSRTVVVAGGSWRLVVVVLVVGGA